MTRKIIGALAVWPLLSAGLVLAQSGSNNLIFVIPNSLNAKPQFTITAQSVDPIRNGGEFADIANSNANFGQLSQGLMRPFNIGIATQLSVLPIASPASGVIFKEDPATGAALPSTSSLGPILTERAETIGKGRLFMGYTRQHYTFDKIEGQDIRNIRALDPGGQSTLILQDGVAQTTSPTGITSNIDLRLDQNVVVFTYGLTRRLDITGALTWVNASVSAVSSDAQIYNTGNPFEDGTCWCAQTFSIDSSRSTFNSDFGRSGFTVPGVFGSARRTSSGIGDTLLRIKGTVWEGRSAAFALGGDLRLPTGEELNYHGSGAVGVKPFAALSLHSRQFGGIRVSPHFNVGYQYNGKSVLAGDFFNNEKGDLPDAFMWAGGAEVTVLDRATFIADFLGTTLIDSNRLVQITLPGRGVGAASATGWTLAPDRQTFTMTNGGFGIKLKLAGNLVLNANMMVALDNKGLRDKVTPLFGLGYTF